MSAAFWQAMLVILLGDGILIAANWGGFQSHDYYQGQPAWGKAGLTAALMIGSLFVAVTAVVLLGSFFSRAESPVARSGYVMPTNGVVFKETQRPSKPAEIVDLEGKPLVDAKTGRMIDLRDLQLRAARTTQFKTEQDEWARFRPWMQADNSLFFAWHATPDTLDRKSVV